MVTLGNISRVLTVVYSDTVTRSHGGSIKESVMNGVRSQR